MAAKPPPVPPPSSRALGRRPPTLDQPDWSVYKRRPGLVLGFHGCDRAVGEAVITGKDPHLRPSRNDYDWLGEGIYFWESDPWRAMAFAQQAKADKHLTKGKISDPFVVGAVIDLGLCLNLLEIEALNEVAEAHRYVEAAAQAVDDGRMPVNRGPEMGLRKLDKAVIEAVHQLRRIYKLPEYSSARAAFMEGGELYPSSGFKAKNHIQIAIRDPLCILGYFRLPGT